MPGAEVKMEMVIPRLAARGIRSGAFKKDVLKPRTTGALDVTLIYGPPDRDFVRRYRFKTKLHFNFRQDPDGKFITGAVGDEFVSEQDTPL